MRPRNVATFRRMLDLRSANVRFDVVTRIGLVAHRFTAALRVHNRRAELVWTVRFDDDALVFHVHKKVESRFMR